jgi:hypothetical protein
MGPVWALLPPAVCAAATVYPAVTGWAPRWLWISTAIVCFLLCDLCVLLWLFLARPRIVFDGANVVLNVGLARPAVVPVELVEAFLLGKGPAYLTGKDDYKTEATTLIVKLAERAEEFAKLPTNVRIAAWCGHYVTFRGTWTEPLSVALVNRLNERLHAVQHAEVAERAAT